MLLFKSHLHVSHFKPSISRDGIESTTVGVHASNGNCFRVCCMYLQVLLSTLLLVMWNFYVNTLMHVNLTQHFFFCLEALIFRTLIGPYLLLRVELAIQNFELLY